ncbi:MAG TPA: PfkB family carbohydrate kinase, partial [Acidobacteriota bacterium]|nr:PfkB family carbohydrate kinase [Acidobacteriota bacterium]
MDYYSDLQQEFVGGISLNFAVNCRRAGAETVSLVSCVGNDYTARIIHKLANEGVDASHVKIQPGPTARQNIIVHPGGERVFPAGGYDAGVLADYHLDSSDVRFVQSHNLLCVPFFKQIEPLF